MILVEEETSTEHRPYFRYDGTWCNLCTSEETRDYLTGEPGRVQWPCDQVDPNAYTSAVRPTYNSDPVAALEADHLTPTLRMTDTHR